MAHLQKKLMKQHRCMQTTSTNKDEKCRVQTPTG